MAEAKKAETEAEAPAAKPKGKLILFIAIGVLVLVLIGGGATYFLMKKKAPAEGEELKKAEPGVGVKGKDYGGPGFVTTPIETMFKIEDRIAFEVQIPKAMDLYKADHNNKGPKTHEEFMNVIIKEHAVQLPELPPGNVYWYDAKTEQLMVRTEKKDS